MLDEQAWEDIYTEWETQNEYRENPDDEEKWFIVYWEATVHGSSEIQAENEDEAMDIFNASGEGAELQNIHEIIEWRSRGADIL